MSFVFHPGWLMRLLVCQLLPLLCVSVLGSSSAWAASAGSGVDPGTAPATADEPAPMCDPNGASVAAGDEIPEIDRGHFEALPCEAQLLLAGWRPDDPEFGCKALRFDARDSSPPGPPEVPRARCEGAREGSVPFPARAEPTLLASDVLEGLAPSRGHSRALFRPPVVRARVTRRR
jgi:hypothetical protein